MRAVATSTVDATATRETVGELLRWRTHIAMYEDAVDAKAAVDSST